METLFTFHQNFDGHIFVDNKGEVREEIGSYHKHLVSLTDCPLNPLLGNEHRVVVEFSPFQKIPKELKKPDPRQNTIETGTYYTVA